MRHAKEDCGMGVSSSQLLRRPRAVCISVYGIATMRKPATTVGGRPRVERLCDRREQRLDRPHLGTTHKDGALRPPRLQRVAVRRRGRPPHATRPTPRQPCCHTRDLMGCELVLQLEVSWRQGRTQDLALLTTTKP